jgi:hypothetical protein
MALHSVGQDFGAQQEPPFAGIADTRSKGLGDFRAHDLRRTTAMRTVEMGINPRTISRIRNHVRTSKFTITGKVYLQYRFDHE